MDITKLRRRLESYLRNSNPQTVVKAADFLRAISPVDDPNRNLLEVPEQLRKHVESQGD